MLLRRSVRLAILILAASTVAALFAKTPAKSASSGVPTPTYSVGILPFQDASGSDNGSQLTAVLAKKLQADLLNQTQLVPRLVKPPDGRSPDNPVDLSTAVQLGRSSHIDLVVVGSLLLADVENQSKSFSGPSFGGISLSGSGRSQDATVVVQIDIVDANRGTKLTSVRATGKDHEGKISPDVSTNYGSMDMGSAQFQGTTLGKATERAVQNLVQQVEHTAENFTPAAPPPSAPPAAAPATDSQNPPPPDGVAPAATAPPPSDSSPTESAGIGDPPAGVCRVYFRVVLSAVMVPLKDYTVKVDGVDHSSALHNGSLTLDNPPAQLSLEVSVKNPPPGVRLQPLYAAQVPCQCGASAQKELVLEIGWKGEGKFNWWY
jgi:Curli production assembly/transport component CsgG